MPSGTILKVTKKSYLYFGHEIVFVMMQFSLFDQLFFFPCKKGKILMHVSRIHLILMIKSEPDQIREKLSTYLKSANST